MKRLLTLAGLAALPVLVLGVFFVLPVTGMLGQGLWPDGRFAPGDVLEVLARPRVHRVLWFTVWVAATATLVTLLLGVPTAYALHRLRVPGRSVIRAAFLVPFVLPTVVVGIAFDRLVSTGPLEVLGLDGSPVTIIAAMVFFNLAVVVRTVGAAWEGLDPRPGEAAAALGASPWQVFRTATFPALRGSVVSAASVVFLFCSTAFGIVLVLGGLRYSTVETEIYLLTTSLFDLPAAAALCLLQLLVVTVLLLLAARARSAPGQAARRRVEPSRVRLYDAPALLATALGLLLVAVPIAMLVTGSLRVDGAWSLANYRALDTTGGDGLVDVTVVEALVNSLRTAVDATWIALLIGGLVAVIATRRSHGPAERRIRGLLDGFFMLPLGVSAVTLGFGFLITLDEPPVNFRESPLLVPIAQALVAMPLVVRTLVPVLAGIDDRQRQAAHSLGASPLRALVTIDLAVVWKPLLAAAGFAFAISLGEFGATSFLSRVDHPTLPVLIYRLLGQPGTHNYGMALAAAVVLALATASVMFVVERLRVPGVGGF
ncbi:ABC transporter permease [Nocardioides sp. Root151]|uniref:ABC transporter permease n=1 Tax=Nocardioides sp. Root151 TaxID=1736475 RepID=UPI0007029943|nr:iron ABC transporter permease [Nocardioides sp. Root151]KQZ75861.1 iron ABC transporter permease [Nocardioides sp. Root151]